MRPRQETAPGPDGENAFRVPAEEPVTSAKPGRSRQRGTSRYTPPNFRSKTEEPANSLVKERTRSTEAPSLVESTSEAPRRRFRRPISRAVTEGPKGNELEDSPIVRIAQGGLKRTPSRSRSAAKEDENDKITNIKVFKKPAAVNRDIYARTRYTRKRNNVEENSSKVEEAPSSLSASPTTVAISTTLDEGTANDTLKDSTTEEPTSTANVVENYETTSSSVLEDITDRKSVV